jgi:hypothetical protein
MNNDLVRQLNKERTEKSRVNKTFKDSNKALVSNLQKSMNGSKLKTSGYIDKN